MEQGVLAVARVRYVLKVWDIISPSGLFKLALGTMPLHSLVAMFFMEDDLTNHIHKTLIIMSSGALM